MKKKYLISLLLVGLLNLSGCGGGGGSNHDSSQSGNLDSTKMIGTDGVVVLGSSNLSNLERVAEFLRRSASGGPWQAGPDHSWSGHPGLARFATPPTVRLATGMDERERTLSIYAIALINRALPYDQHILLGADAPAGVVGDWRRGLPDIPDGQMFIEFVSDDSSLFISSSGTYHPGASHQNWITEYDEQQGRWENKHLRASDVVLSFDFYRDQPDWQVVSTLVHEIIHSLGFNGHPGQDFSDSIMENAWFRLDGSLPEIDIAGLQVLYLKLGEDTEPEELSSLRLGSWNETSTDITSSLGPVAFGVRHANDVSVPFTVGPEPSAPISLSQLTGTAIWHGNLLGLASNLQTVAGDASISVDFTSMLGTVRFSDLRSYPRLTVPMSEKGLIWGDGGLNYDIRVGSNYLYSIGGDAGVVSGAFYGQNHNHVGGTVERSDLTAAFGGTR